MTGQIERLQAFCVIFGMRQQNVNTATGVVGHISAIPMIYLGRREAVGSVEVAGAALRRVEADWDEQRLGSFDGWKVDTTTVLPVCAEWVVDSGPCHATEVRVAGPCDPSCN